MPNNDGKSGNRLGYKIYSVNTTLRNPYRNKSYLAALRPLEGLPLDDDFAKVFFSSIIEQGQYRSLNIKPSIKNKIENGIPLTGDEAAQMMADNPQATGRLGRVMTEMRALKDLCLVQFYKNDSGKQCAKLTSLGNSLLDGKMSETDLYTKILVGLQANNPERPKMLNKSRPFLNTLFVINEVNKRTAEQGQEPKGIFEHELVAFVLSMKDCNWKKAADKILWYRHTFGNTIDKNYISRWLYEDNGILPLDEHTLFCDYPHEVMMKFGMTDLLTVKALHGNYKRIDFAATNKEKADEIINAYSNYEWKEFSTSEQYIDFVSSIKLPWETDSEAREKVLRAKAAAIGAKIDSAKNIAEQERAIDEANCNQYLRKTITETGFSYEQVRKELLILSGTCEEDSKYDPIPEPTRLEWMLALLLASKYGLSHVVSNMYFNEDGTPRGTAGGGKADLTLSDDSNHFLLEPTTIRNATQMLNSETESVCDHLKKEGVTGVKPKALMIAPILHERVVDFFRYQTTQAGVDLIPVTIDSFVSMVDNSRSLDALSSEVMAAKAALSTMKSDEYTNYQNEKRALISKP